MGEIMIQTYILSVPYDRNRVDFARRLAKLADIIISRKGPQRRVQVSVDSTRMTDLKDLLPKDIRIEPLVKHELAVPGGTVGSP